MGIRRGMAGKEAFATAGDNTAAGGGKVLPLSVDAKGEKKDRGGRGKVGKSSCIDDDERRRRHSFALGKVNPNHHLLSLRTLSNER